MNCNDPLNDFILLEESFDDTAIEYYIFLVEIKRPFIEVLLAVLRVHEHDTRALEQLVFDRGVVCEGVTRGYDVSQGS